MIPVVFRLTVGPATVRVTPVGIKRPCLFLTSKTPFTVVLAATRTVALPGDVRLFVVATVRLFSLFVALGTSTDVTLSKPM